MMFTVICILTSLICVVSYIYYDATHIYTKKLIKSDYLFLTHNNKTVSIDAKILKNIINNKNNTWSLTIVSYAYTNMIASPDNNINFRFNGDYLIINYKSKKYGFIQLISNKKFNNLRKTLDNLIELSEKK